LFNTYITICNNHHWSSTIVIPIENPKLFSHKLILAVSKQTDFWYYLKKRGSAENYMTQLFLPLFEALQILPFSTYVILVAP
jgi:hypothetical protein